MHEDLNSNSGEDSGTPGPDSQASGSFENINAFASLSIPSFRLLLTGSIGSNAAQWIQAITLSWLVYDLTGSGTILGSINLVRTIASVCSIPVAGLLVDRLNRRKLITIENGALFAITFMLGMMLLLSHISVWYLFIFAFIASIIQTIDRTLRQVLIFDIVPRHLTPNAVALIQTGWSIMRVAGPSIGGFLILWSGAGTNFLIQASIYVLVAVTILRIKFPAQRSDIPDSSPIQNIKEGLQFVVKERVTRTFMLIGVILPILTLPVFTTLPPIYAVKVFGDESGKTLGLLMASLGVGGIIGGLFTASLGRFEYRGRLQLLSLFLLNISLIAFAFSSNLVLALLCLASAGFFELIFLTSNQTMIQLSIPDNLRGRVTAVVGLSMAVAPIGDLIAGVGSDLLGGPQMITIILTSIGAGITIFIFLFSPTVRNYRLSQGMKSYKAK